MQRIAMLSACGLAACGRIAFDPGELVRDDAPTDTGRDAPMLVTPFGDIVIAGGADDSVLGVAIDPQANIYAVGRFGGTVDFGAGQVTATGPHDAFVASYAGDGALRWVRAFGGAGDDKAMAVVVLPSGNIAIAGHFEGVTDFLGAQLVPQGPDDAFVLELTPAGGFVRVARYGGADAQVEYGNDDGSALVVGPQGRLIVGGSFRGTVDFGAGPMTSGGAGISAYVTSPAPFAASPWSFRYGVSALNTIRGLATDASSVYLAGYYEGTPDLGTGPLPTAGIQDGVVARLVGATGAVVWARGFGGSQFDYANRVGVGADGTVFAIGFFQTTAEFGKGPVTARGPRDAVLVAYAPDGVVRFVVPFGSPGCDDARALLVEPDAVWIAGTFEATMTIGGMTIDATSGRDTFVARFAYNGVVESVARIGDSGYEAPTALLRSPRGTLVIGGTSNGPGECGGASGGDGDGDLWLHEL